MKDKRSFLDSNVCLYLLDKNVSKKEVAENLLHLDHVFISTQVLNENISVGIRKFKLPHKALVAHIDFLLLNCGLLPISVELQKKAISIHFRYHFSFYDSLIIASALEANCTILYSEDLQHNQIIESKLTIVNPFI